YTTLFRSSDGNVREQFERALEVFGGEMERLRVVLLEHALEHLLAADADDQIEAQVGRARRERVEPVAVLVALLGDNENGIGPRAFGVIRRPRAAPEDRQLGRV